MKCTAQGANPDVRQHHAALPLTTNVQHLQWDGRIKVMGAYLLSNATVNLKLLSQDLLQHTWADLRNCRSWKAVSHGTAQVGTAITGNEESHCPPVISESHQWSCAQVPQANGKGTKEQKGKWRTSAVRKLFSSRYPFFKFYGLVCDTWNLSTSL